MKTLNLTILVLLIVLFKAQSQQCNFTSLRNAFYLPGDTIRILHQINTDDGGQLLVGKATNAGSAYSDGLVVKLDASLNVTWSKRVKNNQANASLIFNNAISSVKGGYIIAGFCVKQAIDSEFSYFLLKFDLAGSLIWQNEYTVDKIIGKWEGITLTSLTEDDLSIYAIGTLSGKVLLSDANQFAFLFRMDNGGNLIFSKLYHNNSVQMDSFIGVYSSNGKLVVAGFGEDANNPFKDQRRLYWMELNSDGDIYTAQAWGYQEFGGSEIISYTIQPYLLKSFKTNNGYAITGLLAETVVTKRGLVTFYFDSKLQMIKSWMLPQISGVISANTGDFSIDTEGNMLLAQRSNIQNDKTYLSLYNMNGHLIKQRQVGNFGPNSGVNTLDGGVRIRMFNGGIRLTTNYIHNGAPVSELLDLYRSSNDTICFGKETEFGLSEPFETNSIPATNFNTIDKILSQRQNTINMVSVSIEKENICSSKFNCEKPSLTGLDTVCVFGQPVNYTVHRSENCSMPVKWIFDSINVVKAVALSDTTIAIQWRNTDQGMQTTKLIVELDNCNSASDTVSVVLIPFVRAFQQDTTLCTGDSIRLSPGNWFKYYEWQDGSKDSVFIVKQPGFYKVTYTTFCNQTRTDSVLVKPLNVELVFKSFLQMCKGDSIRIDAMSGYTNYQWLPDYNIKSINNNSATVAPIVDTVYIISADIKPGCRIYDSVAIKTYSAAAIELKAQVRDCEEVLLYVQPIAGDLVISSGRVLQMQKHMSC